MHWARLELPEGQVCAANLHASAGLPERAATEVVRAAEHAIAWSDGDPLVFGGDLNLRPRRNPEPFEELRERCSSPLRRPPTPSTTSSYAVSRSWSDRAGSPPSGAS